MLSSTFYVSPDSSKETALFALHILIKSMKTLIALALLIAPWLIFAAIAVNLGRSSTLGLVITLIVSAFGLTLLISKKK